MLDDGLPDNGHDGEAEFSAAEAPYRGGSLSDDLIAIFDDGKTYVSAELAFQKSRMSFAADRGKSGALYGVVAFALLHLALVALVVGAIFALSPILSPWGATAVVVGALALCGIVFAMMAKSRFARMADAYAETRE